MTTVENGLRCRIAGFLPRALERALASYKMISLMHPHDPRSGGAGDVKKQHDACKVAIAHIELLMKLARWADLPDAQEDNADTQAVTQESLRDLIVSAQREIAGFRGVVSEE